MLFNKRGSVSMRTLSLMLVALFLLPSLAFAQEKQVSDIQILGNANISTEAVMAVVNPIMKVGSPYTEKAVADALAAIRNMGYFGDPASSGFVTAGTETMENGLRVIFTVVENPVVKDIQITGNTVIATEKLRSVMRTSVGQVLNWNTFTQQDIPAIEEVYRSQGYLASVTENARIDENGVLSIPLLETRVEKISVTGNKRTKTEVVLREMELKPGSVLNFRTLIADLTRVYDLDIFERVSTALYNISPGSEVGKVVIDIPVKEKQTGEVTIAVGYSSSERLTGTAKLSQNNFQGMARAINLSWSESDEGGASYEAGYYEPWVDAKHTSMSLNLYNKQTYRFGSSTVSSDQNNGDYRERRKGGSGTLSRLFGKKNRGYFTLRSEDVSTDIEDSTTVVNQFDPLIAHGKVTSGTFRLAHDTRDSQLDPFNGRYGSYSMELGNADVDKIDTSLVKDGGAPKVVSKTSFFTKYNSEFRGYFSKGGQRKDTTEQRRVLATRLMAGTLTGDVPFYEQFFLGGADSLRGYKEERFWGKYVFLASAEYRVPMASSLKGVLFVDAGDAWGAPDNYRLSTSSTTGEATSEDLISGMPQHRDFKLSVGYGLGVRVVTPIGPLRLDYGFGSEGSRLHFSMGHVF